MELVDLVLGLITAFFLVLLFANIVVEDSLAKQRIEDYLLKSKVSEEAFLSLTGEGLPPYWHSSLSKTKRIGIMRDNYGNIVSDPKLQELANLCNSNVAFVKEKLGVPDYMNLYFEMVRISDNYKFSFCPSPVVADEKFIKETFVTYNDSTYLLRMIMWK